MLDHKRPLDELLQRDQRYHRDSYLFVFDSLRYAQEKLDMGRVAASSPSRDASEESGEYDDFDEAFDEDFVDDETDAQRHQHVTGQDLCEAIRRYALDQYGLLAKSVLNHWGVHSTDDFGEIVFNLIDIGEMRKTDNDRREDFSDVYDFAQALDIRQVFADTRGDGQEPTD